MTDTETPIEAGARALHDRTYAGLDVKPWGMRTDAGRERFVGDARAVFGSVGVEGLAGVLAAHDLPEPDVLRCRCGYIPCPGPGEAEVPYMHRHVAKAVIAWMTGGGA